MELAQAGFVVGQIAEAKRRNNQIERSRANWEMQRIGFERDR